MATALDPDFNHWEAATPFATRLAADEAKRDWRGILDELEKVTRLVVSLPGQADRFFSQATRGELSVRTSWSAESTQTLRRVEASVNRLVWAVIFAALLLAAVAVYVTQGQGPVVYALLALTALALAVVLIRR
jgi:hypothetical protein